MFLWYGHFKIKAKLWKQTATGMLSQKLVICINWKDSNFRYVFGIVFLQSVIKFGSFRIIYSEIPFLPSREFFFKRRGMRFIVPCMFPLSLADVIQVLLSRNDFHYAVAKITCKLMEPKWMERGSFLSSWVLAFLDCLETSFSKGSFPTNPPP